MAAGMIGLLADYPRLQEMAKVLMEKKQSRFVSLREQKEAELTLKELRQLAERAHGQPINQTA